MLRIIQVTWYVIKIVFCQSSYPTGHIERTLEKKENMLEIQDPFSTNMRKLPTEDSKPIMGINPLHEQYSLSKWCYDTPGTVQPEQVSND